VGLAEKALAGSEDLVLERFRVSRLAASAILDEARGDASAGLERYDQAARRWVEHGHAFERAHALFGAGRCLLRLGRDEDGQRRLDAASRIFERLGARPALETVRSLTG
jgi:hypothetical protein